MRLSTSPTLLRAVVVVCFFLAWEIVARAGLVPQIVISPLSSIAIWGVSHWNEVSPNFQITLIEIGISILLVWPLGVSLGLLIGLRRYLHLLLTPLLTAFFAAPLIIFYELFIVWVGIGPESKVIFASLYGFIPIVLNTATGVKSIEREYMLLSKSTGANAVQTLYKVFLPLALPSIIAGLRIGTALVVVGVLVTELLASYAGMGFLIAQYYQMFSTSAVYFVVFLSMLIIIAINSLFEYLQKRLSRWRRL